MSWWAFGISMTISAIGTDMQQRSARDAAKAANKTAYFNAAEKRKEAAQVMKVAADNARRKQSDTDRILARLRAETAGSGTTMSGSPLAIFGETAKQQMLDILDISFEAETRRRALLAGADLDVTEGSLQASGIRNEATAQGISSATGAAMGGMKATGYLG